jgi:BolA protein
MCEAQARRQGRPRILRRHGSMTAQNRASRLEAKLRATFAPIELQVQDDSARHEGHAGATPGGETHFNVRIVSETFTGLSRVARSRAVNTAVADEFATGLHALSLKLRAPGEDQT